MHVGHLFNWDGPFFPYQFDEDHFDISDMRVTSNERYVQVDCKIASQNENNMTSFRYVRRADRFFFEAYRGYVFVISCVLGDTFRFYSDREGLCVFFTVLFVDFSQVRIDTRFLRNFFRTFKGFLVEKLFALLYEVSSRFLILVVFVLFNYNGRRRHRRSFQDVPIDFCLTYFDRFLEDGSNDATSRFIYYLYEVNCRLFCWLTNEV